MASLFFGIGHGWPPLNKKRRLKTNGGESKPRWRMSMQRGVAPWALGHGFHSLNLLYHYYHYFFKLVLFVVVVVAVGGGGVGVGVGVVVEYSPVSTYIPTWAEEMIFFKVAPYLRLHVAGRIQSFHQSYFPGCSPSFTRIRFWSGLVDRWEHQPLLRFIAV